MFTVFLILFATGSALAQCPPKEVLAPCRCDLRFNELTCYSMNGTQLKDALHRISNYGRFKNYRRLAINLVKSEEIPADVSANLTFLWININVDVRELNPELKRIHFQAFAGTAKTIEKLQIRKVPNLISSNSSTSSYNIFKLVNSFPNLQALEFTSLVLTTIPKEAFKLPKLNSLWLGGVAGDGKLTIEDDAFYHLKVLKVFNLINNGINYLSSNSFRMQNAEEILHIYLDENNLNSTSFANNSLSQFNKRTILSLYGNQIDYLDKRVFKPFFESNAYNLIDTIAANPINCTDCRNYWLIKDQEKYKKRVSHAYCDGQVRGPKLFEKKFDHCKNTTIYLK